MEQDIKKIFERILAQTTRKDVVAEARRLYARSKKVTDLDATAVIQQRLSFLASLPPEATPPKPMSLKRAKAEFEKSHHGLNEVKDAILDYLSVILSGGKPTGVLLLDGPSGLGKTSIAKTIAKVLNRPFFELSTLSRSSLKGFKNTFENAEPGEVLKGIIDSKSNTPVILLDEIDKSASSNKVLSAILELLDSVRNQSYRDDFLGYGYDISGCIFICTANDVDQIPPALMSRLEKITLSAYTMDEKVSIARDYMIPDIRQTAKLSEEGFDISPEAMERMIRGYTSEAGVRKLRTLIWRLAQKVSRERLEGKVRKRAIGVSDIESLLGARIYDLNIDIFEPGEVLGLLYSDSGGEPRIFEASFLSAEVKQDLLVTGQAQSVMLESARLATEYARMKHQKPDARIHIHLPDGSTPKDGPSAGVAFYAAVASLISGKTLRKIAMTGEITLKGKVLGVGAVKSKIEGAWDAGIREFIIPKENSGDLSSIRRKVRATSVIHEVSNLSEVYAILFGADEGEKIPLCSV